MKRTKLNIKMRLLMAATSVAAFFFVAAPIPVHAGGYECTCEEKCTDDHINCDCELCKINHELCCGAEPEESADTEEPVTEGTEDSEETVSDNSAESSVPSVTGSSVSLASSSSGGLWVLAMALA